MRRSRPCRSSKRGLGELNRLKCRFSGTLWQLLKSLRARREDARCRTRACNARALGRSVPRIGGKRDRRLRSRFSPRTKERSRNARTAPGRRGGAATRHKERARTATDMPRGAEGQSFNGIMPLPSSSSSCEPRPRASVILSDEIALASMKLNRRRGETDFDRGTNALAEIMSGKIRCRQ